MSRDSNRLLGLGTGSKVQPSWAAPATCVCMSSPTPHPLSARIYSCGILPTYSSLALVLTYGYLPERNSDFYFDKGWHDSEMLPAHFLTLCVPRLLATSYWHRLSIRTFE